MKINNISFPHPVLGISDDISGIIKTDSAVRYYHDKTTISVTWNLDCQSLQNFISNKEASYCVEVICAGTLFRKTFASFENTQELIINTCDLRNVVKLSFYIIATENMPNYSINEFNTDYSGYSFDIQKGDVLAIGGNSSFPAEKSWEALKSVSSFMVVVKGTEKTGPIKYNFDDQKIKIFLPKEDYDNYKLRYKTDNLSAIFHSSMVLPALMGALNIVFTRLDGNEDKKWVEVLKVRLNSDEFKNKLKIKSIESDNLLEIAQAILDNPLHRTLNGLNLFLKQQERREDDY